MAEKGISNTALGAAICRMIEQYEPAATRLFVDPFAEAFVGPVVHLLLRFRGMRRLTMSQMDAITPGIFGAQVCRTRRIDDAVRAALAEGTAQLVILGAGLDSRPYRLKGLENVKVFEVDLPAVQAIKRKKIRKRLGGEPGNVVFVPIDFEAQALGPTLEAAGFDPSRRTLFLWEGVTQYLREEAVRRILAFVGGTRAGNGIVLTYVLKSIIEHRSDIKGADQMMARIARSAPWVFGIEPSGVEAFLEPVHLRRIADVGEADYQRDYLLPLKRSLAVFPGERVVQATVTR